LPKFARSDVSSWVRMAQAILKNTDEGIYFLTKFNSEAGLAYLFNHFREEDRRDLGWDELDSVMGTERSLINRCLSTWSTADSKVTNAMAKFNLLKNGLDIAKSNGDLIDWARKVYGYEQSIRSNIDVKLLCCEIVASLPVDGQSFCLARSVEFNDWSKFMNLLQQYHSMLVAKQSGSGNSNGSSTTSSGSGSSSTTEQLVSYGSAKRGYRGRNNKWNNNYNKVNDGRCYRCGRIGHIGRECGFDTHVDGRKIEDDRGAGYTAYTAVIDSPYSRFIDKEIYGDDDENIVGFGEDDRLFEDDGSYNIDSDGKPKTLGNGPFYVVKAGREPGVYEKLADANDQIIGFSGAKMKKFTRWKDAEDYLNSG